MRRFYFFTVIALFAALLQTGGCATRTTRGTGTNQRVAGTTERATVGAGVNQVVIRTTDNGLRINLGTVTGANAGAGAGAGTAAGTGAAGTGAGANGAGVVAGNLLLINSSGTEQVFRVMGDGVPTTNVTLGSGQSTTMFVNFVQGGYAATGGAAGAAAATATNQVQVAMVPNGINVNLSNVPGAPGGTAAGRGGTAGAGGTAAGGGGTPAGGGATPATPATPATQTGATSNGNLRVVNSRTTAQGLQVIGGGVTPTTVVLAPGQATAMYVNWGGPVNANAGAGAGTAAGT